MKIVFSCLDEILLVGVISAVKMGEDAHGKRPAEPLEIAFDFGSDNVHSRVRPERIYNKNGQVRSARVRGAEFLNDGFINLNAFGGG